jgi:alpha-L-glutamate ligase-like protein
MADILYGAYSHDHADRVIVEEKIVPHPFFHEIYPVGIPDIRLIFHNDQPIQGMLRIPTRKSQGKANLHQGAFGIGIDLDSGVLGHGIRKNRKLDVHPDSGIRFSGMKIPDWHRFMEISSRTAELVPLKFLGIDLIMDRERGPLVIEINARPGLQIQNANGTGLLDTVRIKQGGTL